MAEQSVTMAAAVSARLNKAGLALGLLDRGAYASEWRVLLSAGTAGWMQAKHATMASHCSMVTDAALHAR